MRAPTAAEALIAWERGNERGQVERGLELFALARPGVPLEELADVSVGERDGALLDLRAAMFGPELTGRLSCGHCGALQEIALDVDALHVAEPEARELSLSVDGYALSLRRLSSRDLLAAAAAGAAERRGVLVESCVLSATRDGRAAAPRNLPASVVDGIAQALAQADPQADLSLMVACETCGHRTRTTFDIAAFLWDEVDAWTGRLLREIHMLASMYGWSERDILALGPERRRRYVELAGA
ncbi:MAG: hypothetical protein JOZ72_13025 [Alphaproteobacteria bacterium]|nr:hypothetical protein [Alphaproteobacteria bacterium]